MSTIRGYTSLERVEHYTGRTFTDAERAECVLQLPAAEALIDGYTGRAWGMTAAVTGEQHRLGAPIADGSPVLVWLNARPIASVQAVTVRWPGTIGAESTTLVSGDTYDVVDATTGLLAISSAYPGYLVTVDYTPASPVDPRVELAATMLVAAWLSPTLAAASGITLGASGTTSAQVGDVRVTYSSPSAGATAASATAGRLGVPDEALALLKDLRGVRFA